MAMAPSCFLLALTLCLCCRLSWAFDSFRSTSPTFSLDDARAKAWWAPWHRAHVTSFNVSANDNVGGALAVTSGYPGNVTLAAGAAHANYATRAQYVALFSGGGSQWTQTALLQDPLGVTSGDSLFGASLALSPTGVLAVGARNAPRGTSTVGGVVYIYACGLPCYRDAVTRLDPWKIYATLTPPVEDETYGFGYAVTFGDDRVENDKDASATYLFVSAPTRTAVETVYVYGGQGATWTLKQTIASPSQGTQVNFGHALASRRGTLVVGASKTSSDAGAVYLYRLSGTTWTLSDTLAGATTGDRLGYSVAIGWDFVAAGAPAANTTRGQVHVFALTASTVATSATVTIENPLSSKHATTADAFGASVGAHEDILSAGISGASIPAKLTNVGTAVTGRGATFAYYISGKDSEATILSRLETDDDEQNALSSTATPGVSGVVVYDGGVYVANKAKLVYDKRLGEAKTAGGAVNVFAATPLPNLLMANCGDQLTTCLVSHDAPLEMTSARITSREALENNLKWLYTANNPDMQHPRAAANALWSTSVALYGVSCGFLENVPRCGPPFKRDFGPNYEPLNMRGVSLKSANSHP